MNGCIIIVLTLALLIFLTLAASAVAIVFMLYESEPVETEDTHNNKQ